jgi:hypothetical protein
MRRRPGRMARLPNASSARRRSAKGAPVMSSTAARRSRSQAGRRRQTARPEDLSIGNHLRKEASERLAGFAAKLGCARLLEHEAAEAVPLRLVLPPKDFASMSRIPPRRASEAGSSLEATSRRRPHVGVMDGRWAGAGRTRNLPRSPRENEKSCCNER